MKFHIYSVQRGFKESEYFLNRESRGARCFPADSQHKGPGILRACRKVLDSQQTLDELVSRIAKCESLQEETERAVLLYKRVSQEAPSIASEHQRRRAHPACITVRAGVLTPPTGFPFFSETPCSQLVQTEILAGAE